jgi:hypothetical protein
VECVDGGLAADGLDAADAGGDGGLAEDLAVANDAGAGDVGAAAEFLAEVADGDDADVVLVLLAEEGHGAGGAGVLEGHDFRLDGLVAADVVVHEALDVLQAGGVDALEVGKVEAQAIRRDERARLVHVIAQHVLQRALEEVGRGVVVLDARAAVGVDARVDTRRPTLSTPRLTLREVDRHLADERFVPVICALPSAVSSVPVSPTWPPASA